MESVCDSYSSCVVPRREYHLQGNVWELSNVLVHTARAPSRFFRLKKDTLKNRSKKWKCEEFCSALLAIPSVPLFPDQVFC
jgi:hypothetical protein